MTPDRIASTPDENDEHGVLPEAGGLETSSIGILGGAGTAQVSVSFGISDEDDHHDDDVVDDEHIDLLDSGDLDVEPAPAAPAAVDDAPVGAAPVADGAVEDVVVEDAHDDDAAVDVPIAVAEAPITQTPIAQTPIAQTPVEDSIVTVEDSPVVDDVASVAPIDEVTVEEEAIEATPEIVRVVPVRAEGELVSRRVGDFEPDRESSDLLTADRLLDQSRVATAEPEGLWQQLVYTLSGHRVNLGDSKRVKGRKDLDRRIAAPLDGGARFVPVLSRKGGVGKTTVTTLLGMALAAARDDRVIALDANPDRGTLAERIVPSPGRTVRDLGRLRAEITGFNDVSRMVARDETRLDVIASGSDPRVSEAFSDREYTDVASLAAHYYSIVLTDTGTGIVHSVMGATLELSDELVIVSGLSVDEARLAAETLTWLETNGYAELVRNAVVVLNSSRPGIPLVRESELEAHFASRVRTVVRVPYDPLIATGSTISFRELRPETRAAARQLAAAVVEGLRVLAPAA